MIRLALLPLVVLLCALAPLYQWRESRWKRAAGWLSPGMDEHWRRLANWRAEGDFDHVAKNVLSEWVRLDAQRAGKLFAFLLVLSTVGNLFLILVNI